MSSKKKLIRFACFWGVPKSNDRTCWSYACTCIRVDASKIYGHSVTDKYVEWKVNCSTPLKKGILRVKEILFYHNTCFHSSMYVFTYYFFRFAIVFQEICRWLFTCWRYKVLYKWKTSHIVLYGTDNMYQKWAVPL